MGDDGISWNQVFPPSSSNNDNSTLSLDHARLPRLLKLGLFGVLNL